MSRTEESSGDDERHGDLKRPADVTLHDGRESAGDDRPHFDSRFGSAPLEATPNTAWDSCVSLIGHQVQSPQLQSDEDFIDDASKSARLRVTAATMEYTQADLVVSDAETLVPGAVTKRIAPLFQNAAGEQRIGRFSILAELGMGGMGVVYEAYDANLRRRAAIKVLRHVDANGSARRRMIREAQALAQVSHPNVVSIYEAGEIEGQIYIAMELVDGCNLRDWLAQKDHPLRERLRVIREAGMGLAAAHARGLVHRDFKPENVLVGKDGRVRVVDFGLVTSLEADGVAIHSRIVDPHGDDDSDWSGTHLADPDKNLTRQGACVGTPKYMAPEQHRGEPSTTRSDLFGFCVTACEAIYGVAPFQAASRQGMATAILEGAYQTPQTGMGLRSRLWRVLRQGLAVDASARPHAMEDLLARLRAAEEVPRRLLSRGGMFAAVAAVFVWTMQPSNAADSTCSSLSEEMDALDAYVEQNVSAVKAASLMEATDGEKRGPLRLIGYTQRLRQSIEGRCADEDVFHGSRMEETCLQWRLQELRSTLNVASDAAIAGQSWTDVQWSSAISGLVPASSCAPEIAGVAQPQPPEDPEVLERVQALRLRLHRARSLQLAGRNQEAQLALEMIRAEIEALPCDALRGEMELLLARLQIERGEIEAADDTLQRASIAAELSSYGALKAEILVAQVYFLGFHNNESWHRVEAHFRGLADRKVAPEWLWSEFYCALAMVELVHGRLQESEESARKAHEAALRLGNDQVPALVRLGFSLTLQGRYAEAEVHLQSARTMSRAGGHHEEMLVEGVEGILRMFEGRDREALAAFQRALALQAAKGSKQRHFEAMAQSYSANSLARIGPLSVALTMHQRAVETLAEVWSDEHPALGRAYYQYGFAQLAAQQWDDAETSFGHVERIWTHSHGADHRALAQPLTGQAIVAARRDQWDRALQLLERSKDLIENDPRGHPGEDARTFAWLGKAMLQLDLDRDDARRWLRRGIELWSQLGPGFDRELKLANAWLVELGEANPSPSAHTELSRPHVDPILVPTKRARAAEPDRNER